MDVQPQQPELPHAVEFPSAPAPSTGASDSMRPPSPPHPNSSSQNDDASLSSTSTLLATSSSPPSASPVPASSTSSSPSKRNRRKNSRRNSENAAPSPVCKDEPTPAPPTASQASCLKDSRWMDNTDAESGFSEPDDSQVAHFDFGSSATADHPASCNDDPSKGAPSPLVPDLKWSPQRQSESSGVADLISLPSPVETPASASAFDVFAASPVNVNNGVSPQEQEAATSMYAEKEQPVTEPLVSAMSDLNLAMNGGAGMPHPEESTASDEAQETQKDDISELESIAPSAETTANLSAPSSSTSPAPSPQRPSEHGFVQSQLPSPSEPVVVASAGMSDSLSATDSTAFQPSSPEQLLPPIPSSAHDEPLQDAQAIVKSEGKTDQTAGTSSPIVRDSEAKSASLSHSPPQPAPSASSPLKPGMAAQSEPGSQPAASKKEPKAKDSRVPNHAAVSKAKPSESAKGPVLAKGAPNKLTTVARQDALTTSTAPNTAKRVPPNPRAQRTVMSSLSQPSERATKASQKTALPAPPVPSKRGKVSSPITPAKQNLGSATPPPAPSSTIDSESTPGTKKRLSSSELEAASNRLYADAKESKKRKEARKAALEESFTFAPQVNKFKRRNMPEETARFVLLHEKAKEVSKRKEILKQEHEKSECTFKPKITAKARRLSAKSSKPRFENLYQNAQEIQLKREEKKNEIDQKAVEECSFKPKIKAMKSPAQSRPLYDAERQKQKKLALEQKKLESELSECTFKPKVVAKNTKSKGDEAAGKAVGEDKLFDRLYHASQERAERLEKLRQARHEQEMSIATFQPKITSSGGSGKGATKQPFHERLYNKDHMQKIAADREQKKLEDEQKFTFKPQISLVPDEIKSKQRSASSSPDKSIFERLYEEKDKVKEKIELSEELKMQKEMTECTFRPQIETSPSHPSGQPSVPIWERLLSYDKNQVIEEREKLREQMEMQGCTFKPEVKPLDSFTPKKSPSAGIFERLAGGAASVPSSDMKRRESERKGVSPLAKRNSVPELGAFKEQLRAVSMGDIIKPSKLMVSPETSPSMNQSRSLPSSVRGSDRKKAAHSYDATSLGVSPPKSKSFSNGLDFMLAANRSPEECSSSENNGASEDALSGSPPTSILENYDSWAANLEAKMRNL